MGVRSLPSVFVFSWGPFAPCVRNSDSVGILDAGAGAVRSCAGKLETAMDSFELAVGLADNGCNGGSDCLMMWGCAFSEGLETADKLGSAGFVLVSAIFPCSDAVVGAGFVATDFTALGVVVGEFEGKRIPQNPGAASVNSSST